MPGGVNYSRIPWLTGLLLMTMGWLIWWAIPILPNVTIRGDGPIRFLGFSPDSRMVATIHVEDKVRPAAQRAFAFGPVTLWDARYGREIRKLGKDLLQTKSVVFSPDNQIMLTVSKDPGSTNSLIHAWSMEERESLWNMIVASEYEIHGRGLIYRFTPDSKTLVVLCPDDQLKVLDAQNGNVRATAKGADRFVISPDGGYVAYTNYGTPWVGDKKVVSPVQLLNLVSGQPEPGPVDLTDCIQSLAFSPDSQLLALATPGINSLQKIRITMWNCRKKTIDTTMEGDPGNSLHSVGFSNQGQIFFVKEALLGVMTYWDMSSKPEKLKIDCYDAAISPDGKYIAFSNAMQVLNKHWAMLGGAPSPTAIERQPLIYIWDVKAKKLAHTHSGLANIGTTSVLDYVPGTSTLAVKNTWIKVDAGPVSILRRMLQMRFNEKWVDESNISLLDTNTGKVFGVLEHYDRLAISPDGLLLYASNSDRESSIDLFAIPLRTPWLWIAGCWLFLALLFLLAFWRKQKKITRLTATNQ